MVSLVNRGHLDLIGAARPSIADPFLPKKIEERRIEDVRECIGCNMCTVNQHYSVPIRCTQNPTIGVEWSRDWHPEIVTPARSDDPVLVVGSGPAGLECALTLAKRGYPVTIAEAGHRVGGRVHLESKLPGLAAWGRVADYREYQLRQMGHVDIFLESPLQADDLLEFGFGRIVLATGARWRKDGFGRANSSPIQGWDSANVYSADDVMVGVDIPGPVVIFDDDHYYMGSVLAEKLRREGKDVHLVTPATEIATWTKMTLEWAHVQRRLTELDITRHVSTNITSISPSVVEVQPGFNTAAKRIEGASVVMVTGMTPQDGLLTELRRRENALSEAGISLLETTGDCVAPSSIAQAVFDGHRVAMAIDEVHTDIPYKVEPIKLID
jgi:dimethylamine/trimethylamine dehydrogenase